jgi:hypothetical protein
MKRCTLGEKHQNTGLRHLGIKADGGWEVCWEVLRGVAEEFGIVDF